MAYKRTTRKTGRISKMTTTYNTKTGRTRVTQTVKPTKSLTISRSVNKNGTVKTTRTNNINGWITKKSSTSGTGIFKPKKMKIPKISTRSSSSGGRRRRSSGGSGEGAGTILLLLFAAISGFFWLIWKAIKEIFLAAVMTIKHPNESMTEDQINWKVKLKYYTKIFLIFILYIWLTALLVYYGSILLYQWIFQ